MATSPESVSSHLPPRRNPLTKLAVLLSGVFGLICLACCIGSWFVERQSSNEVVKDAESVVAVAAGIGHIDVPDDFRPSRGQTLHTMFDDIQAAVWESDHGGIILLARTSERFDSMTSEFNRELARIPLGGMLNRHPYYTGAAGTTIDVEIHGEKITFDIADFTMWGTPGVHEASGVFPTADGLTGVIYIRTGEQPETGKEQVENVLRSIR